MKTQEVKEFYNKKIKADNKYEYNRWFKNEIQKAGYVMTKSTVLKYVASKKFDSCLELGPGHGTWTKKLLEANPDASFDLVDISIEMLNLSRKRFSEKENINYYESDFLKFNIDKKYDFFFSSRAIEYIPETDLVVKKIVGLLRDQGEGCIITKTPKYLRAKILGKKVSSFHSGQIKPRVLIKLFKDNNCYIKCYPVTLSFPFLKNAKINLILHKIFGGKELNCLSQFFSESYCVKFSKK